MISFAYRELESRCLEQVRGVQAEMEAEREILTQQSAKQRVKLEKQIEKLKEEETVLKEKLLQTQRVRETNIALFWICNKIGGFNPPPP